MLVENHKPITRDRRTRECCVIYLIQILYSPILITTQVGKWALHTFSNERVHTRGAVFFFQKKNSFH